MYIFTGYTFYAVTPIAGLRLTSRRSITSASIIPPNLTQDNRDRSTYEH